METTKTGTKTFDYLLSSYNFSRGDPIDLIQDAVDIPLWKIVLVNEVNVHFQVQVRFHP